ncbi:SDR family oxidoreductase [Massilia sp. CMS3.1]|uniref:SDR family oxidoreductase n=1 Tax=Massilia sp. CMS3.1 TaxID=3373083 RepID=UPI003EE44DA3
MTILIIGGTGTIGSKLLEQLSTRPVSVKALIHSKLSAPLPPGIAAVNGDLTDIDSMRAALVDVDTVFLLNSVSSDELTKAQLALNLAATAGVKRFVYFSMVNADVFGDVPHASAKYTTEKMIEQCNLEATILRPNYFYQNDALLKTAILDTGVYPIPIGPLGTTMVDARDIAEVAAIKLVEREMSPVRLPNETIEIVGPDAFTGDSMALLWSELTGSPVTYGGDDVPAYEQMMRMEIKAPSWLAYDASLMFRGFLRDGMRGKADSLARVAGILGRVPRSYRNFAEETLAQWQQAK